MNVLASGGFWAFVGVVAGIYTIFALGLQLQFGFAGPAELRPGRLHGDRRLHDGDPRREGGLEHLARRPARSGRRRSGGPPARDPRAAAPRRLLRDRHDRLQRDRPLRRDERERAHRRLAGDDRARQGQHGGAVQRRVGALPGARPGMARRLVEGRRDARDRLDRRSRAAHARLARRANAVGPGAARDPRGRGRGRVARQERARLQAPGARDRLGPRRGRRVLLRLAVLVLQPRRLRSRS